MMKHRKKLLVCLLCAALLLGAAPAAAAADLSALEKAEALYALGLFRGKGMNADGTPDFALSDRATRDEAATMLIRLLGRESKARSQFAAGALRCPFVDTADWAAANVTWLYEGNYINGTGGDTFSGGGIITAQQFAAMVLRALGYTEVSGDFTYAQALPFAVSKGLLTAAQSADWSGDFLRGSMAEMCYNALYLTMRDSKLTLLEKLTNDGVFKASYDLSLDGTGPMALKALYTGGGSVSRWTVEEPAAAQSVCADVDGDGALEIIFSVRSVFCLNAADGSIKWRTPSGHDISENAGDDACFGAAVLSPLVLDVDGDGAVEIVTFATNYASDRTFVGIYDGFGRFISSWTTPHAARAAEVADLDGDGRCEFAMGFGIGGSGDGAVALYDIRGGLLPGWPKQCGYGLYSESIESADLDGDGRRELVMLFDEDQIAAFHMDGSDVIATGGVYSGLPWIGLPLAENFVHEAALAEWARRFGSASGQSDVLLGETREDRYINTGTFGGVTAADVDGNGSEELVFTSMILDGALVMRNGVNSYEGIARYFTCFILNKDRTRYTNAALGFDWTQIPTDTGEIVSLGTDDFPVPKLNPVVADLNSDGRKEILFSSCDGKVHCFDLDGTEHGAWPYALTTRSSAVPEFASMPVTADLNGDGRQEVIFATYTPGSQTAVRGRLIVLSSSGALLAEATLPPWWGYAGAGDLNYADGSRAAPTVADLNGDGKPEILVTTLSCGVCAYQVS